ncbi:MAG: uroporphyrinogen decarboxylase family protein [Candidatus Thorarchaeota archaeon]
MSFVTPSTGDALRGLLYAKGLRFIGLNPGSRSVAAMMGKPDYTPVASAQIHVHAMTVAEADRQRFHQTDGRYCTDVQVNVQKWYGFETPMAMAPEAYNYEIEALGAKMIRSTNNMSTIDQSEPLIKEPEDIKKIRIPIESDWGRAPFVIDSIKGNMERFGSCTGAFCAPFSFICGIHSYPRVIRNIRKNPDFIHSLMTWSIDEVLIPYLEMLKRETGAKSFFGADAWAVIPNVTKGMLEEFIFPYNKYLVTQAKKKGLKALAAVTADYCEDNPEKFDSDLMKWCWSKMGKEMMGMPFLMMGMGKPELWPMEVMQEFVEENKAEGSWPPVAASCSASFIRDSTPYEIAEFVKRVVNGLGRDGHLMFNLIQIPADTPPVNVHSYMEAVRLYGKYPVPENLDEIDFKPPEFEPYKEWLRREIAEGRITPYE